MARFFVEPDNMHSEFMVLTGENADHAKVLRLKTGEEVSVCDGQGREAICVVSDVSPGQISLVVKSTTASDSEPKVKASIYMAFSKGDKFEHVVQKATELGAFEIVIFPSARCISRPDNKSLTKKLERWQRIASSAAEQSGRGVIPRVLAVNSYKEALQRAMLADKAVLFYENEKAVTFKMALQSSSYSSVSLMTGPEGGFELHEVEEAAQAGLQICTLGKRILRCETAPLCALSALMYASGEF